MCTTPNSGLIPRFQNARCRDILLYFDDIKMTNIFHFKSYSTLEIQNIDYNQYKA